MKTFSAAVALGVSLCLLSSAQEATAQIGGGNWGIEAPQIQLVKEPDSLLQESQRGSWLVEATCLSVAADEYKVAQWRIDTVFNGPDSLLNKVFSISHARYEFNGISTNRNGADLGFVPDVNEKALWIVSLEPDLLHVFSPLSGPSLPDGYGLQRVMGQNHSPSHSRGNVPTYAEAMVFAESVRSVAKAHHEEQIRLLKEYVLSPISLKSEWAFATLEQSSDESVPAFLLSLVGDARMSIIGELRLNTALETLDGKDRIKWFGTIKRSELWQRLVSSGANEDEGRSITNTLYQIVSEEERQRVMQAKQYLIVKTQLGERQIAQWLQIAANNEKWAPKARGEALNMIGWLVSVTKIHRLTLWYYLLPYVMGHPDFANLQKPATPAAEPEVRMQLAQGALEGIGQLAPLMPEEIEVLQWLQDHATSEEWKSALSNTIRTRARDSRFNF